MSDLISRQAAIDGKISIQLSDGVEIYSDEAVPVEYLKRLPSAQSEHGRWLHGREVSRDYIGDACVAIHYEKWWCSKCDYPVDGRPLWKFCPYCGVRNEVEE